MREPKRLRATAVLRSPGGCRAAQRGPLDRVAGNAANACRGRCGSQTPSHCKAAFWGLLIDRARGYAWFRRRSNGFCWVVWN
jgi:hypothetical protein